ncbi:extracellular nuclease [Rhodopirellula sallentina SM41]|uniref:Extracellular nuclease n=1 Tax=Rhodopirellula sallentina SM41 TaxID=1263870 RepID=M5UJ66_9BACT|nr:extracellular nuclease [Rhodopirellula sallentina SM41]
MTVTGGTVQLNTAPQEGGGIWNGTGTLNIDGTAVTQNTANSNANAGNDQGGGGVFNDGGTLDIDSATITDNLATTNNGNGGGVMTVGGTVTIDNTTIAANEAARAGGGIENNAGNVTLTGVTVGGPTASEGNTTGVNGGGIHASGVLSSTNINGGSFENNRADQEGGGLWNGGGVMTATGTTIDSNTAFGTGAQQGGGGAFNEVGTLTLDGVTLTNNTASSGLASGGGAFNNLGTMNVLNSVIDGNDKCGLSYFIAEGSITNNAFGVNVGGNLCSLLATDADDVILVTDDAISINANTLNYDDNTLGPITILAMLGNDTFNIQSTDADNPIIADGGDDTDVFNISSDADANSGTLDGLLGDVTIIGNAHNNATPVTASATAQRRPDADAVTVTASSVPGDVLNISDEASVADNAYELTSTTFQRTAVAATAVITYQTVETVNVETGSGDDTVNVASTVNGNIVSLDTNPGNDTVTIETTGNDSILELATESGNDNITLLTTGARSVTSVTTADGLDSVAVINRGTGSGIDIDTGAAIDQITLGGGTALTPSQTDQTAVIHVASGAGEDSFTVNEVFFETVIELDGGADNDTFDLNADGADAAGFLGRINNDPINATGQDAQARTRELLINGGGNGAATRTFVEGTTVDGAGLASEGSVSGQAVGDTININAQSSTVPLDLRYAITQQGQGVLATTLPAADQSARATIGNEVVDSQNVETIQINTGSADDVLTISSDIAFGISNSNQAIRFDGGDPAGAAGTDRLEIVGTDLDDRITVGDSTDGTIEPIETTNVEFVRIDGLDGDDQVSLRNDAVSVLNGGEGDDTLLGGSNQDALAGGPDVDQLFGRNGNDVLFSDRNFGSDDDFPEGGELLDGGNQDTVPPGDICVQIGLDIVRNCEALVDGGAQKDVLTWLQGIIISDSNVSFEDSEELEVFGPVEEPGIPLIETTEPSSLSPTGGLPGGGGTGTGGGGIGDSEPDPQRGEGEVIYDVNRDGLITAIDALRVINRLNAIDASGEATDASSQTGTPIDDEDVNADGTVSALDALMVINLLNSNPADSEPMTAPWQNAVDLVFADDDSFDDDERIEDSLLF